MFFLESNGNIGPPLLASGLLGGFFASIIFFTEWKQKAAELNVGYICLSGQLLAFTVILFTFVAIYRRRNKWIKEKRNSTTVKTKLVVLWILGFAKCFLHVVYDKLHQNCGNLYSLLPPSAGGYIHVVFTIVQMLFITFCSQRTFYDSWKMKYIISLLTISNLSKWLEANIFSIFAKTNSDISEYYAGMSNCTYIKENNLESLFNVTDMLLPPVLMEFSILAALLIITFSLSKKSENEENTLDNLYNRRMTDQNLVSLSIKPLSRKCKLISGIVVIALNAPFLFYGVLFIFNETLLEEIIYQWVLSIIGAKIVIFFLILNAFYALNRKLQMQVEKHRLNFNSVALIICSSAVSLSGVVNFLFPLGQVNYSVITFHTWFNFLYIIYQTIFIIYGTSLEILRGNHNDLAALRMILIILISYNILYWMKDSLFLQRSVENNTRNNFIRTVFFVLYPFQSFYRFQSAMELIPLYNKLCNSPSLISLSC